ncbi:hypothetical protein CWE08_04450 [Aliidiomarina iranensis]|uniref:Uncharacterized protein n=2 Tax=Aliidiomarina iranensis TaxID=1434071 RepID=A0A432W086_9GAMM|nr:hypothetical protein CWE08_04450 [Aliidiomarina iranensis]
MKLFRYLIFLCLLSALAAQATALEKHGLVDGYLDGDGFSSLWVAPPESELEQPDAIITTAGEYSLPRFASPRTCVNSSAHASVHHYFQSRAPPKLL